MLIWSFSARGRALCCPALARVEDHTQFLLSARTWGRVQEPCSDLFPPAPAVSSERRVLPLSWFTPFRNLPSPDSGQVNSPLRRICLPMTVRFFEFTHIPLAFGGGERGDEPSNGRSSSNWLQCSSSDELPCLLADSVFHS